MSASLGTGRRRVLGAALGATAVVAVAPAGILEAAAAARPIGDEDVGPNEDLMREHGVLRRILIVYDEAVRRLQAGEEVPLDRLHAAADLVRRFVEDYHEKQEESDLFPRFQRAGRLTDLVDVLLHQHQAGRRLTGSILDLTSAGSAGRDRAALAEALTRFTRMYRPHAAREDTVLFPALRDLVTRNEYMKLGDTFEKRETQVLGEGGFERARDEVAGLERAFGVGELASFTPKG
ncbi:MAG TPA: hemerythrin domain-containing protein [Vicinamibacteria bacterium]|nr:hemerythrin domain-containing protein [Vicinamibacteria bacterium]